MEYEFNGRVCISQISFFFCCILPFVFCIFSFEFFIRSQTICMHTKASSHELYPIEREMREKNQWNWIFKWVYTWRCIIWPNMWRHTNVGIFSIVAKKKTHTQIEAIKGWVKENHGKKTMQKESKCKVKDTKIEIEKIRKNKRCQQWPTLLWGACFQQYLYEQTTKSEILRW